MLPTCPRASSTRMMSTFRRRTLVMIAAPTKQSLVQCSDRFTAASYSQPDVQQQKEDMTNHEYLTSSDDGIELSQITGLMNGQLFRNHRFWWYWRLKNWRQRQQHIHKCTACWRYGEHTLVDNDTEADDFNVKVRIVNLQREIRRGHLDEEDHEYTDLFKLQ